MADITHGTWIKDGTPVDEVFSNGRQVYGRNLLINSSSSATNKYTMIPGAGTNITGVYSRTDSYEQVIASSGFNEFFYRPMVPYANKLYGLTPGGTYTLSGSASHTTGELKFRAGYGANGNWSGTDITDLGIAVSDGSVFIPFSHTFTIPIGASGVYISLQNYDYTAGDLFRFNNMKLERGGVATPWTLSPEDILKQEVDN